MGNIVLTAEDMYRAFLRGIRKQNTSIVKPTYWNPFINEVVLKWVKGKLPAVEFSQKRIDDLAILRVVTDGTQLGQAYAPIDETDSGIYGIPTQYTQTTQGYPWAVDYPLYLHGLNCMFRRRDDEWKESRIRKSDKTVMMGNNPYRKPTTTRIYFERIKNDIRMIGGDQEDQLRLEYIRYPKLIQYATDSTNINPEFDPSKNTEIVDLAIRTYLEIIQDPRYKSFLQEEMIRSRDN